MGIDLRQLTEGVRFNCDVADANFAGNYTMCTYLLKMRELYRWHCQIDQSSQLENTSVSDWVQEKETTWDSLVESDFQPITVNQVEYDPFDVEKINAQLGAANLVYGAGYGQGCRPQFFLAELKSYEAYPAYDVIVSEKEYARDLSATVAMSQGRLIYVRLESIRRMVWEQIEAWRWRKSPGTDALAYALMDFPLEQDPEQALDQIAALQLEYAINHEVGEVVAADLLGSDWADMLMENSGSRLEIIARAIKDHLADALVTLPELLDGHNPAAIHLYFANMTALRKRLFPQLTQAYNQWRETGGNNLSSVINRSFEHWHLQAESLLSRYHNHPEDLKISDEDLISFQPEFVV